MQRDLSEELQPIYNCPPDELLSHTARYKRLLDFFAMKFPGRQPHSIVRAPGRVNLIGEHTDYNGYPVLPMAIDRDFIFVVAPRRDAMIELVNEDPLFEPKTFTAEFPVPQYQQGDWGNYVKAASHGMLEAGWVDARKAVGFQAVVGGTIPESAGLSSSSALVVAAALAFLAANKVAVDYKALADLLARAERYVGSEGGGMDQSVSLLAEAGKALKIDFFPLQTEPVPLPKEISFVVCNSLIRAPKSESARYTYNRRVIECRLATVLLAKAIGLRTGKDICAERLADLSAEKLGMGRRTLEEIALQAIGEQPLSIGVIAQRLGKAVESVETQHCKLRDGAVLKEPPDGFRVWNRYRHVVTEAERVALMVKAFQSGDAAEIGALMNQSHTSCRDDYEISCPELEVLVSIAREHGALGARLTGAGFGGCTVNAVPSEQLERFIRGVAEDYYHGYVVREKRSGFTQFTNLHDLIFPCRATRGAGVWPADKLSG